jgi:hypothetical protein
VCGEYKYIAPENVSPAEAKAIAIERARLTALANEFGTNVSQTNLTTTHTINGQTTSDIISLGETEVKGDWLGDTKEPQVETYYEQDRLIVFASVCGQARAIQNAEVELLISVLCNGIESERFYNNNRLSVDFKAPIDGYLSIFLRDDNVGVVSCLMPYETENGKARRVALNTNYTFLSTKDPLYPYREETILVTQKKSEFNTLLFVFSQNPFAMPITEQGKFLPELSVADFQKWLRKNRVKDEKMQVTEKVVEIRSK